jgi:hypothetical protein
LRNYFEIILDTKTKRTMYGFLDNFFCHFRGRGPLKSTMDVINAAKKISEAGTKLDKLSRSILDMVRYYMCWSG